MYRCIFETVQNPVQNLKQINANENCKNDPKCRQPNASSDGSRGSADDLVYSTVTFSKHPHIYSNVVEAQRHKGKDQDEDVEYAFVNCDAGASELNSAVQKRRIWTQGRITCWPDICGRAQKVQTFVFFF